MNYSLLKQTKQEIVLIKLSCETFQCTNAAFGKIPVI